MGGLGTTEIILIVAVLFLLFGASRLPQLAKSIGQSKKAFKEGLDEAEKEAKISEIEAKQVNQMPAAPSVSAMTDDELTAEMRRRHQEAGKSQI